MAKARSRKAPPDNGVDAEIFGLYYHTPAKSYRATTVIRRQKRVLNLVLHTIGRFSRRQLLTPRATGDGDPITLIELMEQVMAAYHLKTTERR